MFLLSSIASSSSGSAPSLSFHIRRNERRAPAYSLRSALSLCRRSFPCCFLRSSSFLLSRSYSRLLLIRPFTDWPATMASADFSPFVVTTSLLAGETSPGTHTFFPSIYLPHLPCMIPCSYWTSTCHAALSSYRASYAISIRQARCLPMGSSRIRLPSDSTS